MTNLERIQKMNVEEMAEFMLSLSVCNYCIKNGNNCFPNFNREEWLNSESEVSDDN